MADPLNLSSAEVAQRKAFLEFSEKDVARLKELHALLADQASFFVEEFYAHLLAFEETRHLIQDDAKLEGLKKTQAAYFDQLTAGDYDDAYIQNRIRVGVAHQRVVQIIAKPLQLIAYSRSQDYTAPAFGSVCVLKKCGRQEVFVIGPELILGKIFDQIGYNQIPQSLFRHLIITRLIYPGSKLKTVDYLLRYKGIYTNEDRIYRYMDKFNLNHKETAIALTFEHTKGILNNQISVAFYDITTLYFEASDEDDLRKTGFSKDGKAQNPQILLALLVGMDGQPMAYEVFEGDKFEGHTLIPVVQAFKIKYNLPSLIIVADAGLLSADNIAELIRLDYPFILGARLKNETDVIKQQVLSHVYKDNSTVTIYKQKNIRLIINYSTKRAKKDAHLRKQGIERLEKSIKSGKLTKEKINNRGYNKYLKIKNEITVEIDYSAFKEDNKWNGLKGYVTNCILSEAEIMDKYKQLWNIEKAFRISKTDLRVRPIYHHLERRIKTHICLAFCSYKIYKELERQLKLKNFPYSVEQVLNALKTIYQAMVVLPYSKKKKLVLLPLDEMQSQLLQIFEIEVG